MRYALLLAPLLLMSCTPSPVTAATIPPKPPGNEALRCKPASEVAAALKQFSAAIDIPWVHYSAEDTKKFLDADNKEEPVTAFHADTMQTISSAGEHSATIIALFVGKKICVMPPVPTKAFMEMLEKSVGVGV